MIKRSDRGVAVVETAITILPFLVFLFGICEAGWFFYMQMNLTNAAREGAKMATRPLTQTDTMMSQDQVRIYLTDFLATMGYNCPSCTTVTQETVGDSFGHAFVCK